MTVALPPAALLDLMSGGLDDSALTANSDSPMILVDLAEPFDAHDLQRLTRLLGAAPVVLVGVSDDPILDDAGIDDPNLEDRGVGGLDILLCSAEVAPAPWIACGSSLHATVEALTRSIADSPEASVVLAQLLRVTEFGSAVDAIVAESWAYSLLQSGPRYAQWLRSRVDRVRRPRPIESVVRVEREDELLRVVLDRPEVHNAYGTRMRDELVEAFRLVAIDDTIERVVVTGNGPSFCSGGDLDEFGTAPPPVDAHRVRTSRNAGVSLIAIADRVECRVHGACVGAGVELPAFAHRVIAHPSTTFRLPELSMGLVPGAGGTSSIPRRIGRHRTAAFAILGEPIDASTALEWGLIDAIEPATSCIETKRDER